MNSDKAKIVEMIQQIRDRLDDVVESLDAYEGPLEGYVERLDFVDDRLFEIETEFESYDIAPCTDEGELITTSQAQESRNTGDEVYKEGVETLIEFAGAVKDIKEAFSLKNLK